MSGKLDEIKENAVTTKQHDFITELPYEDFEWLIEKAERYEILKSELQDRIKRLDKRIEKFEAPSSYDWSSKIERLHSKARAYETVLEIIKD